MLKNITKRYLINYFGLRNLEEFNAIGGKNEMKNQMPFLEEEKVHLKLSNCHTVRICVFLF